MSQTLQIRAKDGALQNPAIHVAPVLVDDDRAAQIMRVLDAIMGEVEAKQTPFITPAIIAPRLGIKANAFRVYCRQTKSLKNWKGSYKFMMDDAEHVEKLRGVLLRALWSMKGASKLLKPKTH